MSQNDMSIANANGATVRADINSALQALASTSKGSARPSTPYAGQLWIEDDTPSSTVWTLWAYDGAQDIALFQIDSTNNIAILPPVAPQSVTVSTGTLDIGAKYSSIVTTSSTSGVTSLGTAPVNTVRTVWHTAALTYTHNGTSQICPGGVNLTVAAGDFVIWISLGSGNWRCMGGYRANGTAFVSSGGCTVTRYTSGSGTHNTTAGTKRTRVRLVGGGGAGGGNPNTGASEFAAGSGGGGGGYVEHEYTSPSATYSYAVGAAGAGASNALGGNGGNTTFGSLTANGGTGGAVGTSAGSLGVRGAIAAGGTASGGNIANVTGGSGECVTGGSGGGVSGAGGSSAFGGAGGAVFNSTSNTVTNGNAGSTGGGGSGSAALNRTSSGTGTGGNGGAGLIIVEEYA